jgi:flagellin
MAATVNTNIASLNAQRNLSASQNSLNTSIQRLSSGLRVNSAKDDAAGLAISQLMSAQARSMVVAIRNANDGISMAQTAEGGMVQIGDMLQRMRELAMQSANGTLTDTDRTDTLKKEYDDLVTEIDRIADTTKFNGVELINGSGASTDFVVDIEGTNNITVDFSALDVTAGTLGVAAGDIDDAASATAILADIDDAIATLNGHRATLGAAQNRLNYTISNLQIAHENQMASVSRIVDADFAMETANMTRGQILQQAGTAMLAQANSMPNTVLQLLRG